MRARIPWIAALGLLTTSGAQAQSPPASAFAARTAGDLAALCGAGPRDANYVAAVHFCHGFLQGAAQYHGSTRLALAASGPIFCPPSPPPSVAQAGTAFASWMARNPGVAGESAIDGLVRWAHAAFPCQGRS